MSGIEAWLRELGREGLTDLLLRRPDVVRSRRQLSTLSAVANELQRPQSAWRALAGQDGLVTGVGEALCALGKVVHRSELAELLREPERVPADSVDAALLRLQELALAWSQEPGIWQVSAGLRAVFAQPFGLGPPLQRLLQACDERTLRIVALRLGVEANGPVQRVRAAVEAGLLSEQAVRDRAVGAPREAREVLQSLTWRDATDGLVATFPSLFHEYEDAGPVPLREVRSAEYQRMQAVLEWLRWNGFLFILSGLEHMPREVAVALRGPGWHPPVHPQPPVVAVDVSRTSVAGDASTAASQLLRDLSSLLTTLADRPASMLRNDYGGIGVREVKRLAKATGTEPDRVDLLLVLAAGRALIARRGQEITATPKAEEWRRLDPARQLADLVREWWLADVSPTHRLDPYTGKTRPVLSYAQVFPRTRRLRMSLLEALAALPEGKGTTGVEGVLDAAEWRRPLGMPDVELMGDAAAAVWREAFALGLVAVDALTQLGRTLVEQGSAEDALLPVASSMLPAVSTTAVFQSDLTAIVEGVASAQLTDLLGSCAVQETSGTVSRWRLGEHSVRGAFDAGTTAPELLERLTAAAARPLPQPLRYLVEDVGRRHGNVRVSPLQCAVVSADEVLLTEIQHERRLAGLGLRRLAPTVLGSRKPDPETVDALRAAGYMPVHEDDAGDVAVDRPRQPGELTTKDSSTGLAPAVVAFAREAFGEQLDATFVKEVVDAVLKE